MSNKLLSEIEIYKVGLLQNRVVMSAMFYMYLCFETKEGKSSYNIGLVHDNRKTLGSGTHSE